MPSLPLTPLDRADLARLARRDAAQAWLVMCARLHRALLVDGTCGRRAHRALHSYQPDYRRGWWDEGFEGSNLSDADIVRRIESWARILAVHPREHDLAYDTLLLLQGVDAGAWDVLAIRAWQEHVGRESWRRLARIAYGSASKKDYCQRLHRDAVSHALSACLREPSTQGRAA